MSGGRRQDVRLSADTLPGKRVFAVLLAAWAFGAVLVGWAWWLHEDSLAELAPARELPRERGEPPAAPDEISGVRQTLLEDPGGLGLRLRSEGRAVLERWDWVDREAALVRLPIDVAIELLAAPPGEEAPGP